MDIAKILVKIPSMSADERKRLRDNAEQHRKSGTPGQMTAAETILRALDEQKTKEEAEHIAYVAGLPVAQRVLEAFRKNPLTEKERELVQVLLDNPGLNSTELGKKQGSNGKAWHLHFGTMCKSRMANLWPAPHFDKSDDNFYSGILADFDNATSGFTMKPEVAKAFAALGITARRRTA